MKKAKRLIVRIRLSEFFALFCTALFLAGILLLKATYRYNVKEAAPEEAEAMVTLPPSNAPTDGGRGITGNPQTR